MADGRQVDEVADQRLWRALDSINDRLSAIEGKLGEVVRLEERAKIQEQLLTSCNRRLEDHGRRIHDAELWQAGYGDKEEVTRGISELKTEVGKLRRKVDNLESHTDVSKGHRDIAKEVLKWVATVSATVLAAFLIFQLNRGG